VPRGSTPAIPSPLAASITSSAARGAPIPPAQGTAADARAVRQPAGSHIHVVVAGESLWSIASDQLARGASTAEIAREVHRLWDLNADVIATGAPDLLPIGTRLALP
jgi:Tfp pilus assembly protein FimV